jgi:hypothetical protein
MKLGDKVSGITSALGIKPCAGCKKRQAQLNAFGRRDILKYCAVTVFTLKNSILKFAWEQLGVAVPMAPDLVLGLMRTLNTIQVVTKGYRGAGFTGPWATREELLLDPRHGVIAHHPEPGDPVDVWHSRLNFYTAEVLPGWQLDHALVGNGYRTILKSVSNTLISDETGIIYRATTPKSAPNASELGSAKEFPGAVPHNLFKEAPGLAQRILRFIQPVVYASNPCGSGTCCQCATQTCLGSPTCQQNSPTDYQLCFFNDGCYDVPPQSAPTPWIILGICPTEQSLCSECQSCAHKWGTYCLCTCQGGPGH